MKKPEWADKATPDYSYNDFVVSSEVSINKLIEVSKSIYIEDEISTKKTMPSLVYNAPNQVLDYIIDNILFKFNSSKDSTEIDILNSLYRKSTSFSEFYRLCRNEVVILNKDWLETEYNSAYHMASSMDTYTRLVQMTDIFPFWELKSDLCDANPNHKLLDGAIFATSHQWWYKLMPPMNWNCNCRIAAKLANEV